MNEIEDFSELKGFDYGYTKPTFKSELLAFVCLIAFIAVLTLLAVTIQQLYG